MTDTTEETQEVEVGELPDPWRRILRTAIVAIVIGLLGLCLGGVSLGVQWRQVQRESARTAWDQNQGDHDRCIAAAESRDVTIETGHAQFDSDFRQLAGRLDTLDLIDGLVSLLPPSDISAEALSRTQASRERIQMDGVKLAADLAQFDASRKPLDPADCPPPPIGPRP